MRYRAYAIPLENIKECRRKQNISAHLFGIELCERPDGEVLRACNTLAVKGSLRPPTLQFLLVEFWVKWRYEVHRNMLATFVRLSDSPMLAAMLHTHKSLERSDLFPVFHQKELWTPQRHQAEVRART